MTGPEVSCSNCIGACCMDMDFTITLEQAAFLIRGGSTLITIAQPSDRDRDAKNFPAQVYRYKSGEFAYYDDNTVEPTKPLVAGYGRYMLIGTCKYLETDDSGRTYCSVYNDEQRPGACSDFEVGSKSCLKMRERKGVFVPEPKLRQK